MDWKNTGLPLLLLGMTFYTASHGPWSTFFSLLALPFALKWLVRTVGIKDKGHFYFAFTLYSTLAALYVFEGITIGALATVTRAEYVMINVLALLTISMMYWARVVGKRAGRVPPIPPKAGEPLNRPGVPRFTNELGLAYQNYDYCRKCEKCLIRRDHHCIWLNMCVGNVNKTAFILGMTSGTGWLFTTSMLNLTSICYPTYLFRGLGLNRGEYPSDSNVTRWFLVPTDCPDTYVDTSATLSFVISIYGLLTAFLLSAAIANQLHLMWLGLTYVEYRKGQRGNPVASGSPQHQPSPPPEPEAVLDTEPEAEPEENIDEAEQQDVAPEMEPPPPPPPSAQASSESLELLIQRPRSNSGSRRLPRSHNAARFPWSNFGERFRSGDRGGSKRRRDISLWHEEEQDISSLLEQPERSTSNPMIVNEHEPNDPLTAIGLTANELVIIEQAEVMLVQALQFQLQEEQRLHQEGLAHMRAQELQARELSARQFQERQQGEQGRGLVQWAEIQRENMHHLINN